MIYWLGEFCYEKKYQVYTGYVVHCFVYFVDLVASELVFLMYSLDNGTLQIPLCRFPQIDAAKSVCNLLCISQDVSHVYHAHRLEPK